jgi:hypothetical protein
MVAGGHPLPNIDEPLGEKPQVGIYDLLAFTLGELACRLGRLLSRP